MSPVTLCRETFATSRLSEFTSVKELVNQTGHPIEQWPLVVLKELVDNALDAAEASDIAPEIDVTVSTERSEIVVADNGQGIPPETVASILDYTIRISSREAYVSPTRRAQGNALKTIVAMPFALENDAPGDVVIEARSVAHSIVFGIDRVRREPLIEHTQTESLVRSGTCVTVRWPISACSILEDAEDDFLRMVWSYAGLNPHLKIRLVWNGEELARKIGVEFDWHKWRARDPTSAHWYTPERFERLIAAHVKQDEDLGRKSRTMREFIATFRGLSSTAKQREVLEATSASGEPLASLFRDSKRVRHLLNQCQYQTRPVKPDDTLSPIHEAYSIMPTC